MSDPKEKSGLIIPNYIIMTSDLEWINLENQGKTIVCVSQCSIPQGNDE